eukprot:GHRR01001992.1.p1 GENE.GHRR01001992.1~~GHRR01001992.1.p1  ORF type:complete len:297 (+),score=77.56 GHRR01001992.1:233-1123(+)
MLPRPTSHSKALGPGVAGPELAVATSAVLAAPPQPIPQHPLSGADNFMVDPHSINDAARQHTQYPYVTGTSVLGIKFKDGVLVACDTLGAYGSTKRYKSVERIKKVNDRVIIAAGGELSDFQYILKLLDELTTDDYRADDGISLGPQEVYAYLCRVMYNRRNKFDPLWNSLVIAGIEAGSSSADPNSGSSEHSFLGTVGMIGTHYTDSHVTTGFANHLARPLFREKQSDDMSEEAAVELMHEALRVCYYRDKQSINKFQLAKVTMEGVSISDPFALDVKWDHKMFTQPTKWAVGAW